MLKNYSDHMKETNRISPMISEACPASSNCRDELNFARELNKKRVLVYLEKVELPMGMKMRLGRLQAIHRYGYQNEEEFYKKVFCTQGLSDCKNDHSF